MKNKEKGLFLLELAISALSGEPLYQDLTGDDVYADDKGVEGVPLVLVTKALKYLKEKDA